MKKLIAITFVAVFALFSMNMAIAQDWSKEQNEVWKAVQDMWKAWQDGNATGVAAALHEKYQGWADEDPLPTSKQKLVEWYTSMKDAMKITRYDIEPARITVLKSAAVVDYYYYFSLSWSMGDEKGSKEVKGKVVEFYVLEGGKWFLLGDMMVHTEGDEEGD